MRKILTQYGFTTGGVIGASLSFAMLGTAGVYPAMIIGVAIGLSVCICLDCLRKEG